MTSFDPDDQFVGGDPLLTYRKRRPSDHDHVGHMVWVGEPVATRAWCAECGDEWILEFKDPDPLTGAVEPRGWRFNPDP